MHSPDEAPIVTGFLAAVVAEKRAEIAARSQRVPAPELRRRVPAAALRDFRGALARRGAIIAEIKHRSPSVPRFRQNGPVEDLARVYAGNGAAAISIVTDELHFGTSLADVGRVRAAVGLPVLVKDFILDDYQILEARAAGADAVLLIARILPVELLAHLLGTTHGLGMPALVECHSVDDVAKALGAGATLVGVNSRRGKGRRRERDPQSGGHRVPARGGRGGVPGRRRVAAIGRSRRHAARADRGRNAGGCCRPRRRRGGAWVKRGSRSAGSRSPRMRACARRWASTTWASSSRRARAG
jgi:indole-3-glycerol phosphate synthase